MENIDKYKGTLAICNLNLVLFVDIEVDTFTGEYYVLDDIRRHYRISSCAQIVFLKDQLSDKDYKKLSRMWILNRSKFN